MHRSKFLQAMAWGQLGRLGEIILSFLLLILVVRRLPIAEFSTYSTIVNFTGFAVLLFSLGLSDGLIKYIPILRNAGAEAPFWLFRRSLAIRLAVSLVVGLLLWLLSSPLASWLGEPLIESNPLLIVLLYFFYSLFDVMVGLFSAQFWIKPIELLRFSGQLGSLLFVVIWFWLVMPGAYILLASLGLVNLIMNAVCLILAWRYGSRTAPLPSGFQPLVRISEIARFCRDIWLIRLVNLGLLGQIDVLLLAALAPDPAAVGYYNLAALLIVRLWTLLVGWSGTLGSMVSTVAVEQGREALARYFTYYYRFNLLLLSLPMVGLAVVSTPLILWLFGQQYEPAGWLVIVFVIQQILNALTGSTIAPAFINILGRQNVMLRWHAFLSLVNVLLDLLLIPWLGALGAVIATTTANSLAGLVDFWLLRELARHLKLGFPLKILIGVISGGLVASFFRGETFLSLLICAAIYLAYLVVFLVLVKPIEEADRQLVARLRPSLSRFLRYF